jgi:hypothetical protein
MNPFAKMLSVALLLAGPAALAQAGEVYVICNPGVTLHPEDVRDVFLGEKQFAGRVRLVPADNSAAQASFLEKALRLDAGKYATAWTKKSFRDGLNPPPITGTDAEALEFVRRNAGACSYTSTTPGPGVSIVAKL